MIAAFEGIGRLKGDVTAVNCIEEARSRDFGRARANREARAVKAHFVAASIAPAKSMAESRQVGRCTAAARAAEAIF
jgi:hypothetical protein